MTALFFLVGDSEKNMASADEFKYDNEGRVIVYVDGCVLNNGVQNLPNRGGIGVYFGPDNKLNYFGPVEGKPSNNVAEIQAATKALQLCRKAGKMMVLLHSDSLIVTGEHTPTKGLNAEEYKKLKVAELGMDVKYVHVKKCGKIQWHGEADKLAKEGAKNAEFIYC